MGDSVMRKMTTVVEEKHGDDVKRELLQGDALVKELELSLKMKDAAAMSTKAYASDKAKAVVFESANAPKEVPLPSFMAPIISATLVPADKIVEEAKRLREELSLFDKRTEHGHLMRANDTAEANAHMAHRLFLTVRLELEKWERDNEVVFGNLRSESNKVLQREKDLGHRSKAITDKDVEAKMAELFPDEWRSTEGRRKEAEAAVESFRDLHFQWQSRCRTVNAMLKSSR